jgi:hypothetical protein
MSCYPDAMSLRDARNLFFKRGNLGADGGYSSRWVRVESKPIAFYFPNCRSRVAAARLHDLHHIVAEYDTDWAGEAEIAGWEIASGCTHYYAAWILNLGAFAAGLIIAPGSLFRAFVRGRHARTNLYHRGFSELQLRDMTVGMLRARLAVGASSVKVRASDAVMFAFWSAAAALWLLAPLVAMILGFFIMRSLFVTRQA